MKMFESQKNLDNIKSCAKRDKNQKSRIEVRVFVKLSFLLEKVEDLTSRTVLEGKIKLLFGLKSVNHFDDEGMLYVNLEKGKHKGGWRKYENVSFSLDVSLLVTLFNFVFLENFECVYCACILFAG